MQSTPHLSRDQRVVLAELLQSRLLEFKRERASQLDGLTQAESARQTLLQDADDARQRAGEHEVKGIVSDIESGEFNEIRNALQRIHGADYGLCIDCHAAIPFERLKLEPQTLRCIKCQNLHEQNC
jgi:DnaK suppressor protein